MKFVLYVFAFALLSGCVPMYKTMQPESEVIVFDENGMPIEDASAYLIRYSNPYRVFIDKEVALTDKNGVAKFNEINEWARVLLLPHGNPAYFWNWCIRKKGYVTQISNYQLTQQFKTHMRFLLPKGASQLCKDVIKEYNSNK